MSFEMEPSVFFPASFSCCCLVRFFSLFFVVVSFLCVLISTCTVVILPWLIAQIPWARIRVPSCFFLVLILFTIFLFFFSPIPVIEFHIGSSVAIFPVLCILLHLSLLRRLCISHAEHVLKLLSSVHEKGAHWGEMSRAFKRGRGKVKDREREPSSGAVQCHDCKG